MIFFDNVHERKVVTERERERREQLESFFSFL